MIEEGSNAMQTFIFLCHFIRGAFSGVIEKLQDNQLVNRLHTFWLIFTIFDIRDCGHIFLKTILSQRIHS